VKTHEDDITPQQHHNLIVDSNIDENHSVITKNGKTGMVSLIHRKSVNYNKKNQFLRNFEKSKKLSDKPENRWVYHF
jgi:hypothetical protein